MNTSSSSNRRLVPRLRFVHHLEQIPHLLARSVHESHLEIDPLTLDQRDIEHRSLGFTFNQSDFTLVLIQLLKPSYSDPKHT